MLEQFSDEEIRTLKKELKELDKKNGPRQKPYNVYYSKVQELFADRPFTDKEYKNANESYKNTANAVLTSIDKITSRTLDCVSIDDYENGHVKVYTMQGIPPETYKEYCQMWDEIIAVIEKHIKPYKRFAGRSEYERMD